ncbi:MAG TPA: M15 family metallopeptidase [Candidatus Saccharimonadales bacterium]|nr:M15 family metallopeptidase [Candidatus Saccharimonadales bacterium]
MRKKILAAVLIIILAGGYFLFIRSDNKASAPGSSAKSRSSGGQIRLNNKQTSQYTIDNPDSVYYIVNKKRALPSSFVPKNLVTFEGKQLRSDAANAMNQLFDGARADGINFKMISGYRSYQYQVGVYGNYVRRDGQAKADTYSARPGHSEHQTGLAADVGTGTCDLSICFGDSAGGRWLVDNAYKYGFIIRYPKDKENLTGYQYEPWHIRYLGIDLATQVQKSGKTLEQFFGLPPATDY